MSESSAGQSASESSSSIFQIGKSSVRILIPSRRQDGGIVNANVRADWDGRARAQLSQAPFGGFTPSDVIGSFAHNDGRVTKEEVTVLTSNCPAKVLRDEHAKLRILEFAKQLCAALGQESIFIGWGDLAILVSAGFDIHAIPVIRFDDLSPDAQLKHLTMGWGGIDGSSKVIQVLSLDTWTLPAESEADSSRADARLTVHAVLREGKETRRTWSWAGSLPALKEARRSWREGAEPLPGDLIFMQSRPDYVDLLLVTKKGLAGPRDLRMSHSQLNPVTSHILLRILRREWSALEQDLEQRALDRGFFPRLQKLRSAVETAVKTAEVVQQPKQATRKGTAAKKGTKKSAPPAPAPRSAFRTSVLIVGRMMFLRFLAQKGWLPGGVEGLIRAFEEYGDTFYEKHVLPLWFDALNRPEDERSAPIKKQFPGDLPYLNGGLFQPRPGEKDLRLPGNLFDPSVPGSFLQLFRDFEFSLNEHAGSDDSLKIDPSIFGRALETFNSLEDQKAEGVHYTPKPIAWALALEAIVERVAQISSVDRTKLEALIQGKRNLTGREAKRVSDVLNNLRIIDPAVGSGVLLWASLEVMLALDSACDGITGGQQGYQRGSMKWGERSRHFVCNCLYGVDLSEEAVELTRLRLWLSVALSESSAQPLPDLELNVTKGDSLLLTPNGGAARPGNGKAKQLGLEFDERNRAEVKLERLMKKYLDAGETHPEAQRQIRADIMAVRRELAASGDAGPGEELPLDWRMFFPHVFRDAEKRGFDVVIANPPYIRIQQIRKSAQGENYVSNWKSLASGNADLSYAFVELALADLAAPAGGQVAFIQPNFRHNDAAKTLRNMLVGQEPKIPARVRLWVDFDDAQIFPTAKNYVALLFAERTTGGPPQAEFEYSNPPEGSWVDTEDLSWLRPHGGTHRQAAGEDWLTVPADLRERVLEAQRRSPRRLGDLAEIHVGVQTSADGIFLFEKATDVGKGLLEVVPKGGSSTFLVERDAVRPCVKGSATEEFFLLFPYDQDGDLRSEASLKKLFPKAWRYLLANRAALEAREGGKFEGKDWYRFGRQQGYAVAALPKVLVPSLMRGPVAIPDPEGKLAFTASGKGGGGAWGLVPKEGVTLEDLAAVLTSSTAWDHYLMYGSPQQGGWRGVDREVLLNLPMLPRAP